MRFLATILLFLTIGFVHETVAYDSAASEKNAVQPAPNGISIPAGYKDWRVIATAHRTDNNTLRVILGNDLAVEAARSGKTNPWPEGAVLAKIVWKQKNDENWAAAHVPAALAHAEFMIKDSKKYAGTGGWGYARWIGMDQKPYGKDANFAQECVGCHTPVKSMDYVFTRPAPLP
ncbi:MAG: cytochrome P460 family protein [Nitrospirae bacterium]|nr:cytochrome P460 family protein [Nitrospirota bacterium]MBI3393260.1 cytochrome P460 family protein [Nitrospirota bacterium]